tara:strand:+ start:49 stop:840 length:792 start_codon:yes stop_codon:yes gene_type:complete
MADKDYGGGLGSGYGGTDRDDDRNYSGAGNKDKQFSPAPSVPEVETPTKPGFGLGLLSNFKNFGENAFIDRYTKMGLSPELAAIASQQVNISPGDMYSGIKSLGKNTLGTGYNIASTGAMTGYNPTALGALGFMGKTGQILGAMFSKKPQDLMDPSNYEMAAPGAPMQYTGPVGHFNTAQISQLEDIQGGLTPQQQVDIAISQFEKEEAEKNARPGSPISEPVTETFINPVESKFTEEQLMAYNEYITRGYPPEIAEYLVTKA